MEVPEVKLAGRATPLLFNNHPLLLSQLLSMLYAQFKRFITVVHFRSLLFVLFT